MMLSRERWTAIIKVQSNIAGMTDRTTGKKEDSAVGKKYTAT